MASSSHKYNFEYSNPASEHSSKRLITECLVCGGARLHYQFSISGNRVVRCDDCDLLLVSPQPSDTDLDTVREQDGCADSQDRKDSRAKDYLEVLERYYGGHTGQLLLVDCDQLELLAAAATHGFTVCATDKSIAKCDIARLRIRNSTAIKTVYGEIWNVPGEGLYDVCVIFNELGRTRDPRLFLNHVHRLLRPDGVIFIVTPPLQLRGRASNKTKFRADHLFYFRSSVLQSLLIDSGFSEIILAPRKNVPSGNIIHMARKVARREKHVLSVVVPVFNEVQTFSAAFEKLLAKQVEGLEIEIVVVESNSTDGTRAEVLKYSDHPRVKVVLEDAPRG